MNVTNLKNAMKKRVLPLLVCGMMCPSGAALAQDIINITSDQAGNTYTASGSTIDIKIRLLGNFALRNNGGTTALYPQLRMVVNGDVAWADLYTLSAEYSQGFYRTYAVFRYEVKPGDMASPLKIYGSAGTGSLAGDAYQFYWNGWEVYNQTSGSNAVWQVNTGSAEMAVTTETLNFASQKVILKTLNFADATSPTTVAATETTSWHVTTVNPIESSVVDFYVWSPNTNIVQIGSVAGQSALLVSMATGTTDASLSIKGLAVGTADIYLQRTKDYQNYINGTNGLAGATNYVKRTITVTAAPEPTVSILMSDTGTDTTTLNETNALNTGAFTVNLSQAFTNDVYVRLNLAPTGYVTFATSPFVVRVPAGSLASSEQKFNVLDGNVTSMWGVVISPTITNAAAASYYTRLRTATVYAQNVKPALTLPKSTDTIIAVRGVPYAYQWQAADVTSDLAKGMTATWNFNGEAITNVTGSSGTINYTFNTTGTKTVKVTVTDKDGAVSDEVQFTVTVNTPTPKPSVRVVPTALDYPESVTNNLGQVTVNSSTLTVYLSESYSDDVWVLLTAKLQGAAQSNIVFSTTNAIRIAQGNTNSAAIKFNLPDGTLPSGVYGIDIVPSVTNAPAKTYFTDMQQVTVFVENVNPVISYPLARDITLPPSPEYTNVPMSRPFSFTYTVDDVDRDGPTMQLFWDFGDSTTGVVTGASGSIAHTYNALGIKYVTVYALDKDGGSSVKVKFPVRVVAPPPDPTVAILSPAGVLSETTTPKTGSFIVQLSEAFTNVVVVDLSYSPVTNAVNGAIVFSTNRVTFAVGETEKTVYISAKDGTDVSWGAGFTIIPTVVGNAAATNYFKTVTTGYVEVMNVAPKITTPLATDVTTDDILYTVPQGAPYTFTWVVDDVPNDWSTMRLEWDFGDGNYAIGWGRSGTVTNTYTTTGDVVVSVRATDKDGGTSFVQFKISVQPTKEVVVTPIGPNFESSYYGASGLGNGMVFSEAARKPAANRNNTYFFYYNPGVNSATLEAVPYKTGTLGYYNVTNYSNSGAAVVSTNRTLFDSFFFVWVGTDQGLPEAKLSPATATSTTGIQLPATQTTTTGTTTEGVEIRDVQAIFSREWRIQDNLGDINQDGIPDKTAIAIETKGTTGSTTDTTTSGALPIGMSNLSGYNEDADSTGAVVGDYLPLNPTGLLGVFDFRPISDGNGGNNFTAFLEVRGYHPGLNLTDVSDADGEKDEPYTDPTLEDTDSDGLPDGFEFYFWYNATFKGMTGSEYNPNDIANGKLIESKTIRLNFIPSTTVGTSYNVSPVAPSTQDTDKDGLTDFEEMIIGTNPVNWDTDGDGICDSWELMRGMNPCKTSDGVLAAEDNLDGDYMAYATVNRQYVKVVQGGTQTNTYLAVGANLGTNTGSFATWYFYGSTNAGAPLAVGRPVTLATNALVVSVVNTNAVIMHYQVLREFGFDPRTAWTMSLNNIQHPTRWPGWLATAQNTKPFTAQDEYLLMKFMSENRVNGATDTMTPNAVTWKSFTTDPMTPDSDATPIANDGLPDGWELYVSIDPTVDLMVEANRTMTISPWNPLDGDVDHPVVDMRDGVNNRREFAGTDSSAAYADTAMYNASNMVGVVTITPVDTTWINKFWPTNPWSPDTDGDGLDDLAEMTFVYGSPVDNGTWCVQGGGLNPNSMDTDCDALPDAWEFEFKGTEPTGAQPFSGLVITNGMDGTFSDYEQDWDADGLKNYQEYWVQGVRSFRYDIPEDGVGAISGKAGLPMDITSDPMALFTEVANEWDRAHLFKDENGPILYVLLPLTNVYNVATKMNLYATTDPRLPDTDGDGMDDYYEMFHGLNPILGDLMERAVGNEVRLDCDRIAKAYFYGTGEPGLTVINPTIAYFNNDWDTGLNLDFTTRPWMTGLPEVDPDADGLLNLEERLLPNTAAPSYSNTDPTPIWLTDDSNTNSVTMRFYGPGANDMFFWPPAPYVPPASVYDYEMNEGYDTDNDGVSDKAEMVGTKNSLSDPQDHDDPYRRQAMWFSGTNSAASSYQGFAYGIWSLRSFTVELWARPEVVTNREQVLIERVLAFLPSDKSNMDDVSEVRRNFRIGIQPDGRVYGLFENMGTHDEHTSTAIVYGDKLEANKWVHLALRMDGANSTFSLLVDGEVSSAVMTTLIPATGTLVIQSDSGNPDTSSEYTLLSGAVVTGAANLNPRRLIRQRWSDYSYFYQGSIDEVRIWDGARSNDEIRSNFRKRFIRDDLMNNRLLVRTDELFGYSRVWTNPLQLPAELLFHYTFDNLFGADSTNGVATSPRGFEDDAAAINRPSYAAVAWWDKMATKSTVYTDYNYLPWIENSVEHLPVYNTGSSVASDGTVLLTNGVADSVYWSYTKAGNTPGTYRFPNSNNPYGFCYGSSGIASDLLPQGNAFAKQVAKMWDGMGASGAWLETRVDSDSDGMPDWWERYMSGTTTGVVWSAVNHANELTFGQQYQWDIAKGMTAANNPFTNPSGWTTVDSNGDGIPDSSTPNASNPVIAQTADSDHDGMPDWWETMFGLDPSDATSINGADGDPDEDGLSNFYEYLSGTNPFARDSDGNGILDVDEDADADGLSNGEEQTYGTNPAEVDSDDDGLGDFDEVTQALNPVESLSPYTPRTLLNDGTGYLTIPKAPMVGGFNIDPNGLRFSLTNWTISASVKLTAAPAADVILIRRLVRSGSMDRLNYELGIDHTTLVPYVQFQTAAGGVCRVDGFRPLEIGVWMNLAGRFGPSEQPGFRKLSFIQDGVVNAQDVNGLTCVTGDQSGDLVVALNLRGEIDEVTVWSEARTDAQIAELQGRTLLFGVLTTDNWWDSDSYVWDDVTSTYIYMQRARALMQSGSVALYLPFDDGRHVEANAALDAPFKVMAVDDFVHYTNGWQTGRTYAGTLVGGIDFSPLTNSLQPVFPLEVGSHENIDSDADGMPDSYEVYYGLDPDYNGDDGNYDVGPDGDPDGDGMPNLFEYYVGTDPWAVDSDSNGILDVNEDPDGDGLANIEEYRMGSHPNRSDTDDDGINDGAEVQARSNPAFSDSPAGLLKSMRLDGTKACQIPSPSVNRQRFNSAAWTIEAWVRPDTAAQTGSLIKYTGSVNVSGAQREVVFYELGLDGGTPYVRMDTALLVPVVSRVNGGALPAGEWTHVAGVFDPNKNALTLYLNGIAMASVQVIEDGLAGSATAAAFPGKAFIGSAGGVIGNIDEVRIWKQALTQDEIVAGIEHLVPAGDKRLICSFRFDDGGVTAEDSAYPIRPPRVFNTSTVAWTGSLDIPMLYCMTGVTFDAGTAYAGTKQESDDYDGDGLPDWWESFTQFRTVTYPVTEVVWHTETNKSSAVDANGVTNDTSVIKRIETDLRVRRERTEVISTMTERSSSVLDLDWGIAYGTVTTIPRYRRASDGTTQGRWTQEPDAAWLLKDVYMTAEEVATAEVRFCFNNRETAGSVIYINGKLIKVADLQSPQYLVTFVPYEDETFETYIWNDWSLYFLDANFVKQGQYFKVGWNRIAVQHNNTDISSAKDNRYEQFWLSLVADAGQKTLIPQNTRWWIYGHPGSMVEPPVDSMGRRWLDPQYGLDTDADTDGDGLPNYYEALVCTNPDSPDTDGDGVLDADEDFDGDGLSNMSEYEMGTDPRLTDTDDDGLIDSADGYVGADGLWATNALLPKVERYLSLDGSGYLESPCLARWSTGTNSFTLRMSVKPYALPVATTNILASREVYSGVYNYALRLLPGGTVEALVTIDMGSGTPVNISVLSSAALAVNAWADLALVVDLEQERVTLRVNGQLSGTASAVLRELPASSGAGLVHTRFGVGFKGAMDDIALYREAMSEANQALVRSDGILAYPTATLQGCYLFDDGTAANGVSGRASWTTGQVQDFAYMFWTGDRQITEGFTESDWTTGWRNAGTLVGTHSAIVDFYTAAQSAALDQDGDGIPDWWEIKHGMNPYSAAGRDGALGDLDGDGLSNYAEYLISDFYKFHPGLDQRLFSTTGSVSDYFLKSGYLYYGEMFSDHDFMEDTWEDQYDPFYTSRNVYDPDGDADEDGWSNWAECRYSIAADAAISDTNTVAISGLMDFEHPVPKLETTFRYNGHQIGDQIVVQTYTSTNMNGRPDATFISACTNRWPQTIVFDNADSGYVRGGTNYLFAFLDLSHDGSWNAGEPCGVATPFGTEIGWDNNPIDIQFTDYTPGYLRMDLSGARSEDVIFGTGSGTGGGSGSGSGAGTLSALAERVRVRRSSVDGYTTYQRVVMDKVFESTRTCIHEGDILGQGDFGLDWGLIDVPTSMNREIAVYEVYVGNATILTNNLKVAVFTNHFDVGSERAVAKATSPLIGQYVYSARPTFKWTMPDGYTAFAIEIRKGSQSGTLIYQSGTIQAPVRNVDTGDYEWEAPIHAGSKLPNGQIFASNTLYAWRVIALNSKFTLTTTPITWSSWNVFRLDVNAPASSSGYGELRAAVKYYGPATTLSGRVKVQVFRNAGFTGVPEAQYTLTDTGVGYMTGATLPGTNVVNAVLRGLTPSYDPTGTIKWAGNYYVRAFIDSNTNNVRDAWESWGYGNYYGETDTPYTPRAYTVAVTTLSKVANIVIEDADSDQDWFPDVWEYEQNPTYADFLSMIGPSEGWSTSTGDTEINSTLSTTSPFLHSSLLLALALGTTDADGDGVGDLAELVLGMNASSASTVADGYTDAQKISLGLSGSDSLSLGITNLGVGGAGAANLTWELDVQKAAGVSRTFLSAVTGVPSDGTATYVIEYTPSLLGADWQPVQTGDVTLDGSSTYSKVIEAADVIDPAKGFYRVRLVK